MLLTKPHQFAGGGYCTSCLLRSSCGIPFKPGASVGRGDTPAIAIRPIGVGISPIHGKAITIGKSSDAKRSAMLEATVAGAQSSPRWPLVIV